MLGKAIAIASEAFKDRKDKGGAPYILHCIHVMNAVSYLGEDAMIVGILHDLVEDCKDWTFDRLSKEGFGQDIIRMLDAMTHREGEEYMEYIKRVSNFKYTSAVKRADLRHNSDVTRLKGLTKKDFDRLEKYARAYEYLRNC